MEGFLLAGYDAGASYPAYASNHINFRNGRVNPAWSERHAVNVVERRNARQYQDGFETRTEARQNIGTQVVADDNGLFRMRLHFVERRANNPRAGFAHIKRLAARDFSIPAHSAPQAG